MCPAPRCHRGRLVVAALVAMLAMPAVAGAQDEVKVASSLLDLVLYVEEQQSQAGKRSEIPLPRGLAIDSNGRVPVVIAVSEMSGTSLEELRALNVIVQAHDVRSGLVQGTIPLRRVRDVARRPWVRIIRLPQYGG